MIGVVLGNGSIVDYLFTSEYIQKLGKIFVIACDGGLRHCNKMDILPDYLLGDFDSVDDKLLERYKNMGIEPVKFPIKKDMTDMELGIELALEKNAEEIVVFGGIGSRMDHSLANIHLLIKGIKKNIPIRIVNENNEIYAVNSEFFIENKIGQTVSIIPLTTKVEGVSAEGFEYPLKNYTLSVGTSLGVSNVVTENMAAITVKKGILLVMMTRD